MVIPAWVWYLLVAASGLSALYIATKLIGHRHSQERHPEPRDRFEQVRALMPELISEMARDVRENPNVRWCVPLDSKWMASNASREHFRYYTSEHPDLLRQFDILENNGYLTDVTPGNRWDPGKHPIYAMTEEFIERLQNAT